MAHFAKVGENNIVEAVIVVNNEVLLDSDGNESEGNGIDFCVATFGGRWIQTSYNGNFRGQFAGIGYYYDETLDQFIAPEIIEDAPVTE
jgi:hypothetical protein